MKIKSILLEIEDDELGYKKVLLSEFINQKQCKIETTVSQSIFEEYPYDIKINIGLECSEYKVSDITKKKDESLNEW